MTTMAACSPPGCSSSTSPPEMTADDAFSDDSGVDVKPHQGLVRDSKRNPDRRNKRKSTEPKKRKEVLLMKRFRWDTDEEDAHEDHEDVFEVLARPGSGDSGCQADLAAPCSVQKNRARPWRKATVKREDEDCASALPAFRQSVICKNETTTAAAPCTAATTTTRPPEEDEEEDEEFEKRPRPRNYKSMSRQRRIEANARERTRVHTISAAFESLRRAVPAYAHNQKLSKLAILRIASAYIVALACLNEGPPRADTMSDCVEQCTRTIQAEGRSRRRTSSNKE